MTLYLDASLIVPLFTPDHFNARADAIVRSWPSEVVVSDVAGLEFTSAVARRVRTGQIIRRDAQVALQNFVAWVSAATNSIQVQHADIAVAAEFISRLDLPLRAADAIHIAAAHRIGATLATFDQQMAQSAGVLGIPVANG